MENENPGGFVSLNALPYSLLPKRGWVDLHGVVEAAELTGNLQRAGWKWGSSGGAVLGVVAAALLALSAEAPAQASPQVSVATLTTQSPTLHGNPQRPRRT